MTDCSDDEATAGTRNIAEPWEKNIRSFSNGSIRVALLDTGGEPVCWSMHLLVLNPGGGNDGGDEYRACHIVNNEGGMGFVAIDFAKLAAAYDPKKGLLLSFPYELYNDGNPGKKGVAKVRVNSKTGAVTVEILRQQGKATGDVGLAILFYGGLAAGVLMSGIAGQGAAALSQYLFGSLTTVTGSGLRFPAARSASPSPLSASSGG